MIYKFSARVALHNVAHYGIGRRECLFKIRNIPRRLRGYFFTWANYAECGIGPIASAGGANKDDVVRSEQLAYFGKHRWII